MTASATNYNKGEFIGPKPKYLFVHAFSSEFKIIAKKKNIVG